MSDDLYLAEVSGDLRERVARLEQRARDHGADYEDLKEQLSEISDKIDTVDKDLTRYRGLIGGVLAVGAAIAAFVKISWEEVVKWLTR